MSTQTTVCWGYDSWTAPLQDVGSTGYYAPHAERYRSWRIFHTESDIGKLVNIRLQWLFFYSTESDQRFQIFAENTATTKNPVFWSWHLADNLDIQRSSRGCQVKSSHMFEQNFIKLSAEVHELSCQKRKKCDENNADSNYSRADPLFSAGVIVSDVGMTAVA